MNVVYLVNLQKQSHVIKAFKDIDSDKMKTTHTLVDDIYKLVKTKNVDRSVDVEAEIENFGEAVKDLMRKEFNNRGVFDGRKLRMSNIGRDDRYLWNHYNDAGPKEPMQPHTPSQVPVRSFD